jgi:hypothetical protein
MKKTFLFTILLTVLLAFSPKVFAASDTEGTSFNYPRNIYMGNLYGAINYLGDEDYFKFVATKSSGVVITSSGMDVEGYVYEQWDTSNPIDHNDDAYSGTTNFKIKFYAVQGKTYYIKVKHYRNEKTGNYTLNVSEYDSGGTNYNSSYGSIGLAWNDRVDAALENATDRDYFYFTPQSNAVISLQSLAYSLNTNLSGILYTYDSSGRWIEVTRSDNFTNSNGTTNYNFKMDLQVYKGQTYYLEVYSSNQSYGGYQILLNDLSYTEVEDVDKNILYNVRSYVTDITPDYKEIKFEVKYELLVGIYSKSGSEDDHLAIFTTTNNVDVVCKSNVHIPRLEYTYSNIFGTVQKQDYAVSKIESGKSGILFDMDTAEFTTNVEGYVEFYVRILDENTDNFNIVFEYAEVDTSTEVQESYGYPWSISLTETQLSHTTIYQGYMQVKDNGKHIY